MKNTDIFVKTAKGTEEVETRSHHLDFKHRTALIPVNGRSSVEQLLPRIPGDGFVLLGSLLRDGFIAPSDGGEIGDAAPEPAPTAAATPKNAPAAAFDLGVIKMKTARKVEALLGPDGEALAMSIEGAKSHAEFVARATRTKDIIQQIRGVARADEFWAATGL